MYQQLQTQQLAAQTLIPEQDLAYTVLTDLKRVVNEYATAATESSCQQIRQMFTNLLNDTLRMQGELYNVMQQQGMYKAASPALRQEMDKQIRQNEQTWQKTQQLLQRLGIQVQQGIQHAGVTGQYQQQNFYQSPQTQQFAYNQQQATNQTAYANQQQAAHQTGFTQNQQRQHVYAQHDSREQHLYGQHKNQQQSQHYV